MWQGRRGCRLEDQAQPLSSDTSTFLAMKQEVCQGEPSLPLGMENLRGGMDTEPFPNHVPSCRASCTTTSPLLQLLHRQKSHREGRESC